MARKRVLKECSEQELLEELARRHADREFRDEMTMDDVELSVERWKSRVDDSAIAAMVKRLKPEKRTAKPCPKCGKRVPVKAAERERTLRSLSGPITFRRNYHYCEKCEYGFYPLDVRLGLPEEGELTSQMEKRVLDFAVNDVYGDGAERWNLHYQDSISDNLLRRVAARVGAQCEAADQGRLQEELRPKADNVAEVLVVAVDGSLLPIVGLEPWKEAKVGVTYRHDPVANVPVEDTQRYTAVVGCLDEFAPVLQESLEAENIDDVPTVIWLADGAVGIWRLADHLAPDAIQILDWYHAVENAMTCGKAVLGEDSPYLPVWQRSVETMLAGGNPEVLIRELMDCMAEVPRGRKGSRAALEALDALIGYYRNNAHRMKYALFREHGYPIGSGIIESAHRHVLQVRMKRAGQRWALCNARRMARLRAAYRTGGPLNLYGAIRRAHRDTITRRAVRQTRRNQFRWARQGVRDIQRSQELQAASDSSN